MTASVALVVAVAFAPQSWKLPLGALSILTLLLGVGMLILGERGRGGERKKEAESRKQKAVNGS